MAATDWSTKPWFRNLCRVRSGLEAPHTWPKPAPKGALAQHDKWKRWMANPKVDWRTAPLWARQLRKEVLLAKVKPGGSPKPIELPPVGKPKCPLAGKNGLYFYNMPGVSSFIGKAKAAGFGWVAGLVHEDVRDVESQHCPPDWEQEVRAAGMLAVGSGWLDASQPIEDQAYVASAFAFDVYLANAEAAFAYTLAEGQHSTENFERSDRFVDEFRKHTNIPGAVSCMWGEDLHLRPWMEGGFDLILPQCYLNDHDWQTPVSGVEKLEEMRQQDGKGWYQLPRGHVEPTVGTWGSRYMPMSSYLPYLRAWGGAYSIWAAEFLSDADYAVLAALRQAA